MTPQVWLTIFGGVCTILVSVTTWGFVTGRFAGTEVQKAAQLAKEFENYKVECNRRFEDANNLSSKAMSYVQGMESRFTREFASRDLTDERFAESHRDRNLLRAEMTILKADQGKLWETIRDRRNSA